MLSTKLCECGCGHYTDLITRTRSDIGTVKGEPRKLASWHFSTFFDLRNQRFGRLTAVERLETVKGKQWLCRCDCGSTIHVRASALRNGNTKSCGCLAGTRPTTNTRTSRTRARNLAATPSCGWEFIGYCKGPLDVAHIDQNPLNNERSNLITLCRSHHFLLDKGVIDPGNPTMPEFYVDSGGKRRYRHTLRRQYLLLRARKQEVASITTQA